MKNSLDRQTETPTCKPVLYLLTFGIVLLFVVVGGEIISRIFYTPHSIPDPPPYNKINPYRPNPYIVNLRPYIFFHIPGAVYAQNFSSHDNKYSINSMGFRGNEFSLIPKNGRNRLLVIGDSVVEGHGVAQGETFPTLLDDKFTDRNIEVLNLGVQGASPIYFAANLERYLSLNPDAVLIIIHENDLYDDEIREKIYFDLPVMEDRKELYSSGTKHFLANHSRLWGLLSTSFHTLTKSPLEITIYRNAQLPGIHAERDSARKLSSFAVPADVFDRRWKMSTKYMNYTADTLEKKGVTLLVSALCTVTLAMADIKEYVDHCQRLENGVKTWAAERDIPFYSLVPVMQEALDKMKTKDILSVNDFHPTPFTHNLIADKLYPFIQENLNAEM